MLRADTTQYTAKFRKGRNALKSASSESILPVQSDHAGVLQTLIRPLHRQTAEFLRSFLPAFTNLCFSPLAVP